MPLSHLFPTEFSPDGPGDDEVLLAARSLGVVGSAQGMLWRELSNPLVDVQRVDRVLRADPVIAARVLKVANSAFYRHAGQIGTIDKALLTLGFDGVRGISAAVGLARMGGRSLQGAALAAHSVAVASIAQDVAVTAGLSCAGEAFLAGLLHDIGLLVEWKLVAQRVAARQPPMPVDPMRHSRLGAVVLAAWQVPLEVSRAVVSHHELPAATALIDQTATCVRAAHVVCAANGMGLPDDGPAQPSSESHAVEFAAIGLDQETWPDFERRAVARAQQLRAEILA